MAKPNVKGQANCMTIYIATERAKESNTVLQSITLANCKLGKLFYSRSVYKSIECQYQSFFFVVVVVCLSNFTSKTELLKGWYQDVSS